MLVCLYWCFQTPTIRNKFFPPSSFNPEHFEDFEYSKQRGKPKDTNNRTIILGDFTMNPVHINWLAVLVSAIAAFLLGSVWYSPLLFLKPWMKASGMTEEKAKSASRTKIFITAFILTFIAAVNLAFFLAEPSITASTGALYGFLTGFGWVLTGIGVVALFEQKSWTYILINGFYWVVSLTIMGLILGAWK
jgi:hypothetical protein